MPVFLRQSRTTLGMLGLLSILHIGVTLVLPLFGMQSESALRVLMISPSDFWNAENPWTLLTAVLVFPSSAGWFFSMPLFMAAGLLLEREFGSGPLLGMLFVSSLGATLGVLIWNTESSFFYAMAELHVWILLWILFIFRGPSILRLGGLTIPIFVPIIVFGFFVFLPVLLWDEMVAQTNWLALLLAFMISLLYARFGMQQDIWQRSDLSGQDKHLERQIPLVQAHSEKRLLRALQKNNPGGLSGQLHQDRARTRPDYQSPEKAGLSSAQAKSTRGQPKTTHDPATANPELSLPSGIRQTAAPAQGVRTGVEHLQGTERDPDTTIPGQNSQTQQTSSGTAASKAPPGDRKLLLNPDTGEFYYK
ncbi:MAG: rhomboid family intramembrane serine protease [Leptospiraceae bacterium]|nr:rhomboid family intramembrane serine protease [Leptospiraceae bacterium]